MSVCPARFVGLPPPGGVTSTVSRVHMKAQSPSTRISWISLCPSICGIGTPGGARSAAANFCLPKGGCPATRNTTSSVISERTVSMSPARVADIQVATRSRICCSSELMAPSSAPLARAPAQ